MPQLIRVLTLGALLGIVELAGGSWAAADDIAVVLRYDNQQALTPVQEQDLLATALRVLETALTLARLMKGGESRENAMGERASR